MSLSAPDVGGTAGMQQTYMAVHGSDRRDNAIQVDGMSVNGIEGDGAIQNYFNQGMFEEMSYQTSALTAEVQSSGVRLNMIPKDGSNTFKGSVFLSHTPGTWQSNNFTPELGRARPAGAEPGRTDLRLQPRARRSDPEETSCGSSAPSAAGASTRRSPIRSTTPIRRSGRYVPDLSPSRPSTTTSSRAAWCG